MQPVVQWVRTSWTKASRGGPDATRRNVTPLAFPLPAGDGPLVHGIVMREGEDFVPHARHQAELPAADELDLRPVGRRLRIQLVASAWGMPRRHRRPPAVLLEPGEWLRWHINYRFSAGCSCGAEWSYRLDTPNLAHGPVDLDAFLGEPHHLVDERGYVR